MDFGYLPNLAHLLIRRVYGTKKLKIEIPNSLKNFEIDSCPFNDIHIIALNASMLQILSTSQFPIEFRKSSFECSKHRYSMAQKIEFKRLSQFEDSSITS